MGQDCNNCVKIKNLEDNLNKLDILVHELNDKVIEMDKKSAVDSEKLDNFNKTVKKIEEGITEIAKKIDSIEKKPIGVMEKVTAAVIGSVITFIITRFLSGN